MIAGTVSGSGEQAKNDALNSIQLFIAGTVRFFQKQGVSFYGPVHLRIIVVNGLKSFQKKKILKLLISNLLLYFVLAVNGWHSLLI